MMKIEAVIHPFKLDEVRAALEPFGCERLTTSEVLLNGAQELKRTDIADASTPLTYRS